MQKPREPLNPEKFNLTLNTLRLRLNSHIIGQPELIDTYLKIITRFQSQLLPTRGPLGSLLILGQTGSGKTHSVDMLAFLLFGSPHKYTRVDCGEFQEEHEIAKLIGAPPGYAGHGRTHAILSQTRLNSYQNQNYPFNILLLDEIEKANDSLWQLLLGALDHGKIHLGDNQTTDLSRTFIVMTSNLGSKEISQINGSLIGFQAQHHQKTSSLQVQNTALRAAQRHFSPEFMNRLDHVVVTPALSPEDIKKIAYRELKLLGSTVKHQHHINFGVTNEVLEFVFKEGYSPIYGAREINRTIRRLITIPVANIISSGQINKHETLIADLSKGRLVFFKLATSYDLNPTLVEKLAKKQREPK